MCIVSYRIQCKINICLSIFQLMCARDKIFTRSLEKFEIWMNEHKGFSNDEYYGLCVIQRLEMLDYQRYTSHLQPTLQQISHQIVQQLFNRIVITTVKYISIFLIEFIVMLSKINAFLWTSVLNRNTIFYIGTSISTTNQIQIIIVNLLSIWYVPIWIQCMGIYYYTYQLCVIVVHSYSQMIITIYGQSTYT